MAWDPTVFFAAARDEGMLAQGVYPAADALPFDCGLQRPDVLLLGDQQQSTSWEIEYETAAIPPLRAGDALSITWLGATRDFVVRNSPNAQSDGYFSKAELTEVIP